MIFRTTAAVCLGVLLAALTLTGVAVAAPVMPSAAPFGQATPVDAVILADESGSIRGAELTGEQQAAAAIVSAAWSSQSQIALYGFGSAAPGSTGGPSAAMDELCGPTGLDPAGVAALTGCAGHIKVRSSNADNTDFASALTVAGDLLSSMGQPQRPRLVFLLTDGNLDLDGQLGVDPGPETTAAQQKLIGQILPNLRRLGVQIWPVGFGQANQGELSLFARGAAQGNPGCPPGDGGIPHATLVGATGNAEIEQVQDQLLTAFASASCGAIIPGTWRTIPPGGTLAIPVEVNPLTTDGSIVVNKGNANVTVSYADPHGARLPDSTPQPAGLLDHAPYVLVTGGPQSTQEALRLDDPVTGPWTVTFFNPTKAAQRVDVSVVWQGEVIPNVTFSPVTGNSGHTVTLQVSPTFDARRIPARYLAGLSASFTVQWTPGGPVRRVPATLVSSTGEFAAPVAVPAGQAGTATVTATVREPGVQGTITSPLSYQPGGGLSVTLAATHGQVVRPGRSLTLNAAVANVDNARQPTAAIEFLLANIGDAGVLLAKPSKPVPVGSGAQNIPVTFSFGPQTRGEVEGTLEWEVVGTTVQHPAGLLDVNVEPPPPPPTPWYEEPWPWAVLAVLVLGAGGLLYARRRQRRDNERAARKERDDEAKREEDAAAAVARANLAVQDAAIALIQRQQTAASPYRRWSGGYCTTRWFTVERRSDGIPLLIETTKSGRGQLRLRREPDGSAFLVDAPDAKPPKRTAPAEDARDAVPPPTEPAPVRVERLDQPFEPPAGAGLDDCLLILTTGQARAYTPVTSTVRYGQELFAGQALPPLQVGRGLNDQPIPMGDFSAPSIDGGVPGTDGTDSSQQKRT